jgi:putative membrane protein
MISFIKEFGSGFLIGIANIIPGVSGGTFLLILGMFQRVMNAVSGLGIPVIRELLVHAAGTLFGRDRTTHLNSFKNMVIEKDLFFLMKLGLGAITAIVVLSDLMMYLLTKQFSGTYAFFFGLILVSTVLSLKLVQKMTLSRMVMLLSGMVVTIAVTAAVNPADKAKTKSDHYKTRYKESHSTIVATQNPPEKRAAVLYTGEFTPGEFAVAALAGAISISAMVLPGISGSLVLILIGQYYKVINAISSLRTLRLDYVIFLACFAVGMIIGGLLFARLVAFVFKRFYHGTIAFLTGLMAGSLYTLWPFKSVVVMDQYVKGAQGITIMHDIAVKTNINILPTGTLECVAALVMCGAGIGIMAFLGRYGEK